MEEKQTDEQKGTTPAPALSEGSVGQEKIKRTNQAAQPNHSRDTPNPDIKIPTHLKEPKEKFQYAEATRRNSREGKPKPGKLSSVAST